jgi:hypothetical protein
VKADRILGRKAYITAVNAQPNSTAYCRHRHPISSAGGFDDGAEDGAEAGAEDGAEDGAGDGAEDGADCRLIDFAISVCAATARLSARSELASQSWNAIFFYERGASRCEGGESACSR